MKSLNLIIPNGNHLETLAKDLSRWSLTSGELCSHLLFFNKISYFSGYDDPKRDSPSVIKMGPSPDFKLMLPPDPALDEQHLVFPFFTSDPNESNAQAVLDKLREGFKTIKSETWICHPRAIRTDMAARHPLAPSVNLQFLDGLVCPPDDTPVDEALDFRDRRKDERAAFFDALYRVSDSIEVDGHAVTVHIPPGLLEDALNDLNKTLIERWVRGVKKSFEFDVRPNAETVSGLMSGLASLSSGGNVAEALASAVISATVISISLTPRIEGNVLTAQALAFAFAASQHFQY